MKKLYDMLPMMIRQFISYFFVGGIAAIVEWLIFAFLSNVIRVDYILSTTQNELLSQEAAPLPRCRTN